MYAQSIATAALVLSLVAPSVATAQGLYYGLKAVQLTEMSNRVWKRTAEYNLILSERKRLGI